MKEQFGRDTSSANRPERPHPLDPQVLAGLEGLALRAERVADGVWAGWHRSLRKGESADFVEHKAYSPGDDPRHIDWRVLGRSDRYMVRQYEAETEMKIMLAVDFSASMSYASGVLDKREVAGILAAALASVALRQGDAAGLLAFGGEVERLVPPASGSEHLYRLAEVLEQCRCAGPTDLRRAVEQCLPHMGRRGLLVLCSDLFDPRSEWIEALKLFAAAGGQALVLQVLDRDELDFPFEDPAVFESMEDERRLLAYPHALRQAYLEEIGAYFALLRRELEGPGLTYERAACDEPCHFPLVRALSRRHRRSLG